MNKTEKKSSIARNLQISFKFVRFTMNPFRNRCRGAGTYENLMIGSCQVLKDPLTLLYAVAYEIWSLDNIYKIGHCDMLLLSVLAVLDQIDFHKVEAYDKTESQTEKVRNR